MLRTATSFLTEKTKFKALFDLICDNDNWKNPIHCVIPRWAHKDYNEACIFFTGGSLKIVDVKEKGSFEQYDLVECKSEGYYVHIGAWYEDTFY